VLLLFFFNNLGLDFNY